MLKNWLKIYFRNTIKNKGFTFLTILGLAIGIAGVIFSTLYWKDETSYNKWNPNKDNVFEVLSKGSQDERYWASSIEPFPRVLVEKTNKIDDYTWFDSNYYSDLYIVNNKKHSLDKILSVQNNFFDFIPFDFVKGSKNEFHKNKNGVAIEESEAKLLFGDKNPINQTINTLEGKSYVIYGIYKLPKQSSFQPKYVISNIYVSLEDNKDSWGNYGTSLLLKLKDTNDKTTIEKISKEILYENKTIRLSKQIGISVEEVIKKYGTYESKLQPLNDSRLNSLVTSVPEGKGNKTFLQINLGLSILILLLSIINYINLSTAQTIRRAKEIGVRKVFGASKLNIIWQFLVETSITTFFALLLGLTLVEVTLPSYNNLINKSLVINILDFSPYIISIFLIVILFAGIFPAIYVSNFKELNVLKGNFSRSKNGIWIRNVMLIFQFSIATFFITNGFIVSQQINHMLKKDLGFKSEQIISIDYKKFNLKGERFNYYQTFKQDLLKIKGVKAVNATAFKFGKNSANSNSGFPLNGRMVQGENMPIDFGFFDMMNIEIKKGRALSPIISSDTISNVLLNESAIKSSGKNVEIGSQFEWNDKKFTLIGVVKDFNLKSPDAKIPPMIFMHYKTIEWMPYTMNSVLIKIDTENTKQTIDNIEKFWKAKVDTDYPFEYEFIDKQFARSYENYTKQEKMFKILNVIVITIALFGLFALSSYTIERKYKEIAIRKVLGAETGSLLKILSKQYIYFAFIGFALAIVPSYYFMQKWLENFAYRIDISVWIYVLAFCLLLSLTLIVVLIKAYAATRINSLNYLKYE